MAVNKITPADLVGKGVIGLPDAPGLSTAAMQEKFEETARSVIIPKVNEVIDTLNTGTVNNADKLGGIAANDYAKYSQIAFEERAIDSLVFRRMGRVVIVYGFVNTSQYGAVTDIVLGVAPFPPHYNYVVTPVLSHVPPYGALESASIWIYSGGEIHLFKQASYTEALYVHFTYICKD